MELLFFCPRWGCENIAWDDFFSQVKVAGYDGVEMGFPFTLSESEKEEIKNGLKKYELQVIGQHWQTVEKDFSTHQEVFKEHLYSLASLNPLFINSQTGKDYYSMEQNLLLFEIANEIFKETGVETLHETHRGKWSFAAHITQQYLQKAPELKIALDISHWCNVAESLLDDQEEAVQAAIAHTHHLHARVGFNEGPQVIDPRSPENEIILNKHLQWWDSIIALKKQQQVNAFTITPEYGAPPYQQVMPYTGEFLGNQWEINCWMKDLLKSRYQ
jgi:sugar phosphate isomerase/epimerase